MNHSISFAGALSQWLSLHTLGRKPGAQKFNQEIAAIITKRWPGYLNASPDGITSELVTRFAERVTHYCPSRWNAILSALQFITPAARSLQRRPLAGGVRAPAGGVGQTSPVARGLDHSFPGTDGPAD